MKLAEKIKSGVYAIAEMSANHNGDLDRALKIVSAAKEAGADCLKIQTYTADSITIDCDADPFMIKGGLWNGYKLYDLYTEAATPYEWHAPIKQACEAAGLDFLSTPFDADGADFLEKLGVDAYKVASYELVDIPLIRHIAKKGKPMIVSCGMGSAGEIEEAIDAITSEGLARESVILLKCSSEYPAPASGLNLATIPDMAERFGVTIGFSDHSMGSAASVAAAALGARVIEKHLCVSRADGGVDSGFSMEPDEFADMTAALKVAYEARGVVSYAGFPYERAGRATRRSVFAIADIAAGAPFGRNNIGVIRPGQGLLPKYYDRLLGQTAARAYKRGEPLDPIELT